MLALERRLCTMRPVGMFTNNPWLRQRHMAETFPAVPDLFGTRAVFSAELGQSKPDPEAFRRLATRLGLQNDPRHVGSLATFWTVAMLGVALGHRLGFYFMPRIRDLKDQQLYRIDRFVNYGMFTPLVTKTVDLNLIEEQWEEMLRVALSLKQRTAPAHVIVQRLTNGFPSDRLSKAFTNIGRIIKTQYIMRYLTDLELRQTVQRQLNKGEYRHKLPRRIFFADQGEFTTGDYEEIMNNASCLSLVSNAILYWNTIKINDIVETLRVQGEDIDKETLSHISLLPFKHVVPNGTYFIEDV